MKAVDPSRETSGERTADVALPTTCIFKEWIHAAIRQPMRERDLWHVEEAIQNSEGEKAIHPIFFRLEYMKVLCFLLPLQSSAIHSGAFWHRISPCILEC